MKKILITAGVISFLANSEIFSLATLTVAVIYGLYKLFAYAADHGLEL